MNRIFSSRKAVAVAALVAIAVALLQNGAPHYASNSEDLNLRAETQVLESFFNDLVAYHKECAQLGKRPNLVRTEIEGVERKSQDLQQRLSNLQNAARNLLNKLKAANRWDTLNQDIVANLSDPQERSFFQSINFKAEIEDAAATIGSRGKEIGVPVENLRRKLASRSWSENESVLVVRAAYAPPVALANASLLCQAGKLLITVIEAVPGQHPPKVVLDITSCACGPKCPGCGYSITGTSCASLGFAAT